MFHSLGLFAFRRRYLVIAAWIVVLCASVPLLPRLHSVLHGGGFANGTSEADRALALLQSDLRYYPSAVTIIFSDKRLHVGEPAFKSDMERALAGLRGLPHLARIDTYDGPRGSPAMVSPDRHATYAVLNFTAPLERTEAGLRQLYAHLHTRRLHTIVTGAPVVYADMERLSTQDLAQVEKYTFPVALVLLVVIFGTLVASGVPLLIGGVSVATTLALLDLLGHVTTMSTFALNVTTMIGLGIGIDYALLMVSRFREEIARRPIEEAVAVTVAQAGRAVLFSGVTVMLGLSGLLLFKATALRSMGVGGALVVLVAVLAALTLVPAVLGVLGPRIDALAVLPHRDSGARFWPAVARAVMRRPWPVIALTLLAVGAIASPVRELKLSIPDATILPESVPSRQGFDMLQKTFRVNADSPILPVVYGSGPILQPRYLAALYDYTRRIARLPGVRTIQSVVNLDPHLKRADYLNLPAELADPPVAAAVAPLVGTHATLVVVYPQRGLSQSQAEALTRRIRAVPLGAGLHRAVGGYTPGAMDYINALYSDFPKAILFVIGSTFVVLLVLFRSVVLPLKAVLMNILSLLGSYGALVFVFQQGHLSGVLNFSSTGFIDEMTPIIMFCTLFGLSMDYEVFLLARIREEYCATGDNARAVEQGLARTGRIITSAALILVVVAGSFAFTNLILVKAVGLGLALAILIDATLIRSLLVPATMRVLGTWNWWAPRPLDHTLGRLERAMGSMETAAEEKQVQLVS
jgi:RND superfamily putative drug exporter